MKKNQSLFIVKCLTPFILPTTKIQSQRDADWVSPLNSFQQYTNGYSVFAFKVSHPKNQSVEKPSRSMQYILRSNDQLSTMNFIELGYSEKFWVHTKQQCTLYLRRCLTRKDMCQANGCLILVNIGKGGIQTSNENLSMCPSSDFK